MFAQDNWAYQSRIEKMGMCFIDRETDPEEYTSKLSDSELEIFEEFLGSDWMDINPSTKVLEIEATEDKPKRFVTSRTMMTEQLKLFTMAFQAFVFMQVFNQINARKLEEGEFNVFAGIIANKAFLVVMVLTICIQVLMVEFGGRIVKCWPLNMNQNLICIAFGFGELPWGLFAKLLPPKMFIKISLEDKKLLSGERKPGMSTLMKKK